jgi:hypothetical protein
VSVGAGAEDVLVVVVVAAALEEQPALGTLLAVARKLLEAGGRGGRGRGGLLGDGLLWRWGCGVVGGGGLGGCAG